MKLLTVTNLFPGEDLPQHGLFVEERLRHLVADNSVSAEVIALRAGARGDARNEIRHGIRVHYLPVPTLPYATNWIDPLLWARALQPLAREISDQSDVEIVLDGHFLYPDGVAVTLVARQLGLPVVLSARGSDVNVKCRNLVMRHWIRWAADKCSAIITVSEALKRELIGCGVSAEKITALRNGVDLNKFSPASYITDTRAAEKYAVLSVGHLLKDKGHHLVIDAISEFENAELTIIGQGPDEEKLRRRATSLGIEDRVKFLGQMPHDKLVDYYRWADVTVLASAREGMPNVILESLSCGTPVVACDVGGVSEVLSEPVAGLLLKERTAAALVDALRRMRDLPQNTEATRQFAADNLSWKPIVEQQLRLYREALAH